jgi:hypothetical protein
MMLRDAMARIERYDNPTALDAGALDRLVAAGDRPIVQFSKPVADALLADLNQLCAKHGDALDVRFYGAGLAPFDGRTLRRLPAVAALEINCLDEMTHPEELERLGHLRSLSLGIDLLDASAVLRSANLARLKRLSIGGTKRGAVDLSPVAKLDQLVYLAVHGDATAIETIGSCSGLQQLRLIGIGRRVGLQFLSDLASLRRLHLLLGGRNNIDELRHSGLSELEVIRVRGFARLDSASFPGLERLAIEDQLQLERLELGESNPKLRCLGLANCKRLRSLIGLRHLPSLRELSLSRVAVDLDELLAQRLPPSLRAFTYYSGRTRVDAEVRRRLDELGYCEG